MPMPKKLSEIRSQKPFQIRAAKNDKTKAEIIIYAAIGESYWSEGVSAKSFSEELKALDPAVDEITVRINSPGGDVFDGVTIYNRLKQHKAKVIVYIDGLAASIASIIALAGDEIHMGEGALYMIHLPWTFAMGNRNDLENTTQRLRDVEDQLISIYHRKTGLDRSEIQSMLEKETWMEADVALEKGFVTDKVSESVPIAASVFDKATWINKAPRSKFNSEESFVKKEISSLQNKIKESLARK